MARPQSENDARRADKTAMLENASMVFGIGWQEDYGEYLGLGAMGKRVA